MGIMGEGAFLEFIGMRDLAALLRFLAEVGVFEKDWTGRVDTDSSNMVRLDQYQKDLASRGMSIEILRARYICFCQRLLDEVLILGDPRVLSTPDARRVWLVRRMCIRFICIWSSLFSTRREVSLILLELSFRNLAPK